MATSPHIFRETECGCSSKYIDKGSIFTSPRNVPQNNNIPSDTVMHILPRLSASQALGNFRDIYSSERDGTKPYRHVSTADFHGKSFTTCTNKNKLLNSSDGIYTGEPGYQSITPIQPSDRRRA